MKRKYMNKSYKLQKGDWGYIAQELLDYTYLSNRVSFSQLKTFYDIVMRGNATTQNGGSFIHHLHSLIDMRNAIGRRCGRYLYKDTDGKYKVSNI